MRPARIKAAIIYKIAKFVSWPSIKDSFTICASEHDPLLDALKEIVVGKELHDRPIRILTIDPAQYIQKRETQCQILLIDDESFSALEGDLKQFMREGTLSICMVHKPIWGTCTAQIFEDENRARIAIDPERAEQSGLKVSSELLDLAVLP